MQQNGRDQLLASLGGFGLRQRGGFVTVLGEKFIPVFKASSEIVRLGVMLYVRFPLFIP